MHANLDQDRELRGGSVVICDDALGQKAVGDQHEVTGKVRTRVVRHWMSST
jgi:hypothetical protein